MGAQVSSFFSSLSNMYCSATLDKHGVKEIAALLLSLKHQGKTMILASHHSDDIDLLCDEVYEMESGKISKQTGGSSK